MIKRIVDKTVIRFASYVAAKIDVPPSVPTESRDRAIRDSVDYADEHMQTALVFRERQKLWHHAFGKRQIEGLIAEFGVWKGDSINYFASLTSQTVYGFDSFHGLKEDWKGRDRPKGSFSLNGHLPRVKQNVALIPGWFDATLPRFLADNHEPFSIIHIDCDTYEAAATVLSIASDRFIKGTIIVFDEYFGYRGWRMGVFKAWQEFIKERSFSYRYLAFSSEQVAVIIE
jgi:hypothetical protein